MKKYKPSLYLLLFIILSNLPPLNVFFRIFGGDSIVRGTNESLYVTKDLKYIYGGKIKDTLQNYCYRQYRAMYPLSNPTLYRLQPIEPWKFWRWGEYLLKEKWHQPYLSVSRKEMDNTFAFFDRVYDSPDNTIGCDTIPSR